MALDRQTVAKRYGKALFEVVQEKDVRSDVLLELAEIKKIIDAEPKFITFMTSPSIKQEDKLAMIKHITDGASEVTTNLLDMLFDYGRIANLEDVIGEFNRLNDEFEKTVRVKVTTAIELDEDQKEKLASSFANVVGAEKVLVDSVIDPDIIGGVVMQSASCVYDGSIKSRIESIKRLLLK